MSSSTSNGSEPDLTKGVSLDAFGGKSMLRGRVGDQAVVLARVGDEVLAVSASCTHYGGPLDKGLVVGETVRCPWHHACFSLRNGEAVDAPAFDPLDCWKVERDGDILTVREKLATGRRSQPSSTPHPENIVIIGGGAAAFACAEMLVRRAYQGRVTMLSADPDLPYDRPNLSKSFLAGKISEKWMPLKPRECYEHGRVDLHLGATVERIDLSGRAVTTEDGREFPFERLLLAPGAEPVRLPIPGADRHHVRTLRSFADARDIIALATEAKTAVVLGSGFIGLETAAALRARGLAVHVVSRDQRPLEKVLGSELGDFVRRLHEAHGEVFHMQDSIVRIDEREVTLESGGTLAADLVIMGVGVRPRVSLAESAGIAVDHGVIVDEYLETSVPGIFAAGDVARWPGGPDGELLRIEHWVVAERHGQAVARNMIGERQPFRDVPFFWSAHHGVSIRYVGHAQGWDTLEIDGDIEARDCLVRYKQAGRTAAIATIGRDIQALEFEVEMETREA